MNIFNLLSIYFQVIDGPVHKTEVTKVQQGHLVGRYSAQNEYKMYLGIPYARAPERFKAPIPPKKWNRVFEATKEGQNCPQILLGQYLGNEDCLFLNVYTPKYARKGHKLPVMVFIHGGAFRLGSGDRLVNGPEYIIEHDVILVTINYRLGVLGFLCLGLEEAPGNAGLKDQRAALKWIKRNIASFGGDEENVTLFGGSAGAVAVSYHMLSPTSRNLFERIILQSGSPLAAWSFTHDPVRSARSALNRFDIDIRDPEEILKYLKSASPEKLAKISGENIVEQVNFIPCAEKAMHNVEPFLSEAPIKTLIRGNFTQVPMIAGFNNKEGLLFHSPIKTTKDVDVKNININNKYQLNEVFEGIRKMYIINKTINEEIDAFSDSVIITPLIELIHIFMMHSNQPVFNYIFQYSGNRNIVKFMTKPGFDGASHGDEMFYLFSIQGLLWPPNKSDQYVINQMSELWTNFAKYGDPTPQSLKDQSILKIDWEPSTQNKLRFLQIDTHTKMVDSPIDERLKFWFDIYQKYGFRT